MYLIIIIIDCAIGAIDMYCYIFPFLFSFFGHVIGAVSCEPVGAFGVP